MALPASLGGTAATYTFLCAALAGNMSAFQAQTGVEGQLLGSQHVGQSGFTKLDHLKFNDF